MSSQPLPSARTAPLNLGEVLQHDPSVVMLNIQVRSDAPNDRISIAAYKAVLVRVSPRFAALLEKGDKTLDVDFGYMSFMIVLQHMYGVMDIVPYLSTGNVIQVLRVAIAYQVDSAKEQAETMIRRKATPNDLLDCICDGEVEVLQDPLLTTLPLKTLEKLLIEVADGTDTAVFNQCMSWVEKNKGDKPAHEALQPLERFFDFTAMENHEAVKAIRATYPSEAAAKKLGDMYGNAPNPKQDAAQALARPRLRARRWHKRVEELPLCWDRYSPAPSPHAVLDQNDRRFSVLVDHEELRYTFLRTKRQYRVGIQRWAMRVCVDVKQEYVLSLGVHIEGTVNIAQQTSVDYAGLEGQHEYRISGRHSVTVVRHWSEDAGSITTCQVDYKDGKFVGDASLDNQVPKLPSTDAEHVIGFEVDFGQSRLLVHNIKTDRVICVIHFAEPLENCTVMPLAALHLKSQSITLQPWPFPK